MSKILAVTTHGTDDPTLSTGAFITAVGAIDAGIEVGIVLVADGAYLTKEAILKTIHGVGFPPLSEIVGKVIENNVPVYV